MNDHPVSSHGFICEQWLALNNKTPHDLSEAMGIGVIRAGKIAAGKVWPTAREAFAIRELTGLSLDNWVPVKPPEF